MNVGWGSEYGDVFLETSEEITVYYYLAKRSGHCLWICCCLCCNRRSHRFTVLQLTSLLDIRFFCRSCSVSPTHHLRRHEWQWPLSILREPRAQKLTPCLSYSVVKCCHVGRLTNTLEKLQGQGGGNAQPVSQQPRRSCRDARLAWHLTSEWRLPKSEVTVVCFMRGLSPTGPIYLPFLQAELMMWWWWVSAKGIQLLDKSGKIRVRPSDVEGSHCGSLDPNPWMTHPRFQVLHC